MKCILSHCWLYIERCQSTMHLTTVCFHQCVKRRLRHQYAQQNSRSAPSEQGSWNCRGHNWRSWILQLTGSWSHSAQTLWGSVTTIKVWPRRKLAVCSLDVKTHAQWLHISALWLTYWYGEKCPEITLIPHRLNPLEISCWKIPFLLFNGWRQHSSHATKWEGLSCLTPPPPRTPSTWKMEKGGGGITCKREEKVPRVQSKKSVKLWFTSRLTHSSAAVTFSLTEEQRIC